jgi:ribose/xylose/arabinose/galactoside ABC-type transport system permease subunit
MVGKFDWPMIVLVFAAMTAVAVWTVSASAFPGMLLHFGNNAFAYLASMRGYPIAQMDWRLYFVAAAVFALCFYIIYRNRTPYPGLKRGLSTPNH